MKIILLAIIVLFSLAIGASAAYAETITFSYDTENLQSTNTWNVTVNQADGSVETSIFAEWLYWYPNGTDTKDRPVRADPVGKFFDRLINDGASIFKPIIEPIAEIVEEIVEIIEEIIPEPESIYTHEEQVLIDDVHRLCGKLNDRLEAIGLALDFDYEEDQYYVDRPIEAKKDAADCRARIELGDNVLSNQYDTFAIQAQLDAIAFNQTITTDISQKNPLDFSIGGDMWTKRANEALEYAQTTLVETYGYGKTYDENHQGDPVYSTIQNRPSDEAIALAEHKQRELASTKAWEAACTTYWYDAGQGTLASTAWDDHLTNGDCDGRILDPFDTRAETYLIITDLYVEKIADELREYEELKQRRIDAIEAQDAAREQKLADAGIRDPTGNSTGN